MSIIETNFGTRLDPHRVALGSATNVTKQGAFYVFSLRVDTDDVREYSFSCLLYTSPSPRDEL